MHCEFNMFFLFPPSLAHKTQSQWKQAIQQGECFAVVYVQQKPSNIFLSFILCAFFIEHHTEIAADQFFHSSPKLKCFGAESSVPAKLHN